ncbi:unnamed protein product, partial [Mesorhabditis belari]|uniref:Uncharacterized protein n=1 Tax=Mesorhabditis belari TaxID=2138241 RepID=A0AAF3EW97_9BILA
MTFTRFFTSSLRVLGRRSVWKIRRKLLVKLEATNERIKEALRGNDDLKTTIGASDIEWEREKIRIAKSRCLLDTHIFPRGIQDEKDAKNFATRLLPGEGKLIFDALRKITVDQYEEHKRLGNAEVHWEDMLRIWYIYFIPTTLFGFIDNTILICVGQEIDSHFGVMLGISILAAAGVSNIFSNLVGIGLPRVIEGWVQHVGLIRPILSTEQWNNRQVRFIVNLAKVCGILLGCTLGLFPLLFTNSVGRSQILEGSTFADPEVSADDEIEGVDAETVKKLRAAENFEKAVGHMQVRVRGQGGLYASALDDYALERGPNLHPVDKRM